MHNTAASLDSDSRELSIALSVKVAVLPLRARSDHPGLEGCTDSAGGGAGLVGARRGPGFLPTRSGKLLAAGRSPDRPRARAQKKFEKAFLGLKTRVLHEMAASLDPDARKLSNAVLKSPKGAL